ncbi:MAG: galactose ABC transporter substrate-binding protein [Spirochaetales bacterium]|nr:galactose ABC transporter substrate-binding protein [Spirochaetales bacterium]
MKYGIHGILILCLFASCSPRLPQAGLFIYREDDLFMSIVTQDILDVSQDRLDLQTEYGLNSQIIQNEQVEAMLEKDVPLMIVNPVDRLGAHALIRRMASEHVPVIFFNREPIPADLQLADNVWYVGARAEQSAVMQAQLAMKLFGDDPQNLNEYDRNGDGAIQVVILKGQQGHQDAEIRTTTVMESFRQAGYLLDVVGIEVANWTRDEGYERMEAVLDEKEGASLELVLSNNDAMALGAISILRQRGFFKDANGNGTVDRMDEDWIPVVGIDGVPEAVEHIEKGYLYGTVINDSLKIARAVVDLAETVLSGGNPLDLGLPIEGGKYIWVDYRPYTFPDNALM